MRDLWPSQEEIQTMIDRCVSSEQFTTEYSNVFEGSEQWRQIETTGGPLYDWDPENTYIQEPPFFQEMGLEVPPIHTIRGARCLVKVGDSVTTDHISPAGAIAKDSPAGQYLISKGIEPKEFNSYGSRRGNHEVMIRGTFANVRVRNHLAPGTEGGWTTDFLELDGGQVKPIYDAAMHYQAEGVPLVVLAGKDYGMGSSRDWAAKGTYLLGVKAVIAESFERIHRSNLVGMGVLPLQFRPEENAKALGLSGQEVFDIEVPEDLRPSQELTVTAKDPDSGETKTFSVIVRADTPVEVEYYRNGGILHTVLRKLVQEG